MVLKGQIFTLDLSFAFFVFCIIIFLFLSDISLITYETKDKYETFVLQKKLFDASEVLITTSDFSKAGLAVYEDNTVKHHELSLEKIRDMGGVGINEIKKRLLLDNYSVCIKISTRDGRILLNKCNLTEGISVRRFVLCGDEECVLEIIAK